MEPTAGQDFVKKIGPWGSALFIILALLVTVMLLTSGRDDPLKGYEPPRDTAYWQTHPQELLAELENNVLPRLEGVAGCEPGAGGLIELSLAKKSFVTTRAAVLNHFDRELFEFIEVP